MNDYTEQQLEQELQGGVSAPGSASKTLAQELSEMFRSDDYVIIKNPFKHKTGWIYVDPHDEVVEEPNHNTRRVYHGPRQIRVLDEGASVTVRGWEALVALDRLFKEYAQEKGNLSMVATDAQARQEFLSLAYGGVFDPASQSSAPAKDKVKSAPKKQTAKPAKKKPADLELDDAEVEDLGFSE